MVSLLFSPQIRGPLVLSPTSTPTILDHTNSTLENRNWTPRSPCRTLSPTCFLPLRPGSTTASYLFLLLLCTLAQARTRASMTLPALQLEAASSLQSRHRTAVRAKNKILPDTTIFQLPLRIVQNSLQQQGLGAHPRFVGLAELHCPQERATH